MAPPKRRGRASGPSDPPGKRERRKATTRRDLIEAGRRLFSRKGLYESRVEDLTSKAGIAKGTYYRYFARKEDLILAVVGEGFAALGEAIDIRADGTSSLRSCIRQVVRAYSEFFAENPDLMRIFHQARGMLKFNRAEWRSLRLVLNAHVLTIASVLGRTREGAALGEARRRDLARLLFGAASGAASVRVSLHPRASVRPLPREWVEALAAVAPNSARRPAPAEGRRR